MNSVIRLDTRGRLVIPTEYRETLDLKEGDEILLSLDKKTNTLIISPIYADHKDLIQIQLDFGDTPGCLAKIAAELAALRVDLVMTESKSYQRGTKARWDIIADISKSTLSIEEIKKKLLASGFVEDMRINRIARDWLHR